MPVPDRPIPLIGKGSQTLAGIDRVPVADSTEQLPVEQSVAVTMALAQIEFFTACEFLDRPFLDRPGHGFTRQMARPLARLFGKAGCTNARKKRVPACFELTFEGHGGQLRQWLERPAHEDYLVPLRGVPEDSGNAFIEKRDRLHMAENQGGGEAG